jgi:hypothetical protein
MVQNVSDVDVLFRDLAHCTEELKEARRSPVRVRRAFARLVDLSQQLTSAMRTEFKKATGARWNASAFGRWTPVSDLFKELRNVEQHRAPIQILVCERQSVRASTDSTAIITFEGTWELHDQLADGTPEGLRAVEADPETGRPSGRVIPPLAREFTFLLHPRTPKLERLLRDAGTADVHELTEQYFKTLDEYVTFFRERIAKEGHSGQSA